MSHPPLPADVQDLRADGWDLRVPTLVLTLGPTVVALLAVASVWNEPAGYSGDIAEVSSWSAFLVGIPIGFGLAAVLIGWFAPRPGAWAMAIGVFPPLFSEGSDDLGGWFALVGWSWLGVVLLDLALVLRQRALADGAVPAPAPGPRPWRADHHRLVRVALAAAVIAGMAVGFARYAEWRGDVRALAERAVPTALPVSAVDTVFDSVFVEVDGRDREFFVGDAADHPVGSTFVVYVDPTGALPPYGAEDADPSGWSDMGIPIGAGLLLLVVVLEVGRRRRRVETLAAADDAGVPVLIRLHPFHDGIEVFADTDRDGLRPLAYLPTLEVLLRQDAPPPRWLDDDSDEPPGLVGESLQPARVVGLVSDGSLCVLRTAAPDGDVAVLASVRPARDRWTLRTVALRIGSRVLGDRINGRLSGRPGERHRDSDDDLDRGPESAPALVRRLLRTARLVAPVGVLALAALGLVALPWLDEGEPGGPEVVLLALPAGSLAAWWWALRRDRVAPSRWGLRLTGTWLDHLVLPGEITEVRQLSRSVVIALGEDEQFEFGPDPLLDERAQQSDLAQLVRSVDDARQRARDGLLEKWESHWPRRLPSITTAVGLAVFAVWAIAGLRG